MNFNFEDVPPYTLQIVLATVPQRQEKIFDQQVREGYFNAYREGAKKLYADQDSNYGNHSEHTEVPVLYNPLRYYMLGNFDIAYITLIDNFKFAQKLFEPHSGKDKEVPNIFATHSFQSFTGITYSTEQKLQDFFYERLTRSRKYFLGICNLKLNNGFLIGNGTRFTHQIKNAVDSVFAKFTKEFGRELEYVLLQCFSWFEMSLLIFTDEPDDVAYIIKHLRRLAISNLEDSDELVRESLYYALQPENLETMKSANVFADTHTYFGLHADLVQEEESSDFVREFREKNIILKTEIEWQLKPGHMEMLSTFLNKLFEPDPVFNSVPRFLLAGKSDYLLQKSNNYINDNLKILRLLESSENSKIYDHIRKMRTRVFFEDKYPSPAKAGRQIIDIHKDLELIGVTIHETSKLDNHLKALKVSRQIRAKVLKIFSNFNNGIQDPILFPFFLDFSVFIEELKLLILKEYREWEEHLSGKVLDDMQIQNLEKALMERIQVFQEGYNIRMMNCYQFEDITDFDLDFNSSIQQLLSSYNMVAYELGNLFYKEYSYGPIVQLHLNDTVANYISINYYIHHLTSPEFVFATISKEVLNFSREDNDRLRYIYAIYEKHKEEIENKNALLFNLIDSGSLDVDYLFIDVIRFAITYNFRFDLFYYWFWTYNLQNASLYDKRGMIDESHFQKELFRIIFIACIFDADKEDVKCPLPELFTYWDRHYKSLLDEVVNFLTFLDEKTITEQLLSFVFGLVHDIDKRTIPADEWLPPSDSRSVRVCKRLRFKYGFKVPEDFFKGLYTRDKIYKRLRDSEDKTISKTSILSFQSFMYNYLNTIYDENGRTISMLRRNWDDGMPLESFIHGHSGHLYVVDQTGGLFFENVSEMKNYFKYSTGAICCIWDYAQKRKKSFIINRLTNKRS